MTNENNFDINRFVNEFNRFDSKSIYFPDGNIKTPEQEASEIASAMRCRDEIQRILSWTCL